MATTDVAIINMALSHCGHTIFIDDRTEDSQEVAVSNVHYDPAVQYVLEDFNWSFSRRFWTLELVTDFSEVTTPHDWTFAYRYPVNTVQIRRMVTALGRRDPNPPPYLIGSDDSGRLIYTDQEDAVAETSSLITDAGLFTAMFAEAVSWWLGALMVPGLAKDPKIASGCVQMYEIVRGRAQVSDSSEAQDHPEEDSEAIRARL